MYGLRTLALVAMSMSGCYVEQDPGYTCVEHYDQARCPAHTVAWGCTVGVVPDGCNESTMMGYSKGYDWIVCCPDGMTP